MVQIKVVGKVELPKHYKKPAKWIAKAPNPIKFEKINALFDEQKGLCYYCGRKCKLKFNALRDQQPLTATIEH